MAHGLGLIDSSQAASLDGVEKECQRKLSQKKFLSSVCWDLLDTVIASSGVKGSRKTLQYDAREFVRSSAEFPHGHADVERYMNRRDVREALHAAECPHTFKECMDPPYNALKHQDGLGVVGDIEKALDGGVKMLFFNGQFDIICRYGPPPPPLLLLLLLLRATLTFALSPPPPPSAATWASSGRWPPSTSRAASSTAAPPAACGSRPARPSRPGTCGRRAG